MSDVDADSIKRELEELEVVIQVRLRKFETRY
jgi:hypothetical protein